MPEKHIEQLEVKVEKYMDRVSKMETKMSSFEVMLASIDKNTSVMADQLKRMNEELGPWKINVHDNTRAVLRMDSDFKDMDERMEKAQRDVERFKIYLAIAAATITFLSPIIFRLVNHWIDYFI